MYNKYRISRSGKKLQGGDEARLLAALPGDVPERTWLLNLVLLYYVIVSEYLYLLQ